MLEVYFSDYLNDLIANGSVDDMFREHVIQQLEEIAELRPAKTGISETIEVEDDEPKGIVWAATTAELIG